MISSRFDAQSTQRFANLTLVGIGVFAVIVLLFHLIRPEYDIMTRFVSEYAVSDPFVFVVFAIAGIALGLGSMALVNAMEALPIEHRSRLGSTLFRIFAVCTIGFGVFPTDEFPTINPPSWHGIIHAILALIGFFSFSIGSLVVSWRLRRIPSWRRMAIPLTALAALCLVFFFLLYSELPIVGLIERIAVALILAWIGLFSTALKSHAVQLSDDKDP